MPHYSTSKSSKKDKAGKVVTALKNFFEKALIRIFIDSPFWSKYWHCHNMGSRSFFIKGRQFHICARCTGIALAVMLAPLVFFLPPADSRLLVVAPTIFFIDGFSQAIRLRESRNWLRFSTGFLAMLSLLLMARDLLLNNA